MMIQMAIVLAMEFKMGRSPKKVTAKNVLTIIDFSQNMIQALWKDDDHFLQVPHFDEGKIKALKQKKKGITLEQFCQLPV
jgi:hypothetical protein